MPIDWDAIIRAIDNPVSPARHTLSEAAETVITAKTFEVPSLREDIAAAVKDIKVGGVTDPIKGGGGYQILRVDERTPAGATATFNENQVREAMMVERQPKEREHYLQKLRNEAFIKVSESYRASVEPLLKLSTPASAKSSEKTDKKKN